MVEYRVKGLTCGHCAHTMETEIQKLTFGEDAKLSYNSGKLLVNAQISMQKVEQILKSEGAYLEKLSAPAAVKGSGSAHSADSHAHSAHDHACHDGHCHEEAAHSHGDSHAHDDHGHDHSHGGGNSHMLKLLLASGVLYGGALLLEQALSAPLLIALYLAAIAISGYTTFWRGLRNLFKLKFNIDTLMTIALVGAIAIGEWKEATLVAVLFGVNEWLEGYGMEKARRSMETLLQVAPKEATKLIDGKELVIPITSLKAQDIVRVKPGEKIPSDGAVTEGKSSVNEAALTGESLPVDKAAGDTVFGGSINNEGVLIIRIDKAYEDSSLAKILHLVEEAQETKTPTELFINKFAKYYTPLIMAIALLVALLPPLLLQGDWTKWLYQGLSVLIVGCPCALILSSPIAIVSGITRNARNGILIKGGVYLEQLGKIDTIAVDKTGTLTKGEPHVVQVEVYEDALFYKVAGAMERSSSHPLAKAVMKTVQESGVSLPEPEEMINVAGRGMEAVIDGERYWLGNEKSIAHLSFPDQVRHTIEQMKASGLTLVIVANANRVLGVFGIADEIREESRAVIAALHQQGIKRTVMLTGDHQKTADKVASAVGVSTFYAGLLPEDKVARIKELGESGKVAMIGDGINDAPALASAQLGIAMGKGTDSAIETADIVLMQDHLGKLPEAISVAKQVNRVIRFNIAVSLGLKVLALLLTIPGWLTLWIAILSDMGATIFVTLVSLTILIPLRKAHAVKLSSSKPLK
ncbi:heavy metal translocating P-type ATPase [Paenibacillus sp. Leaf72]|uniref:heavy metal translocating P-type ATPase n=1 Tax=Paenibacillus sp. Leaf72 TaxID=1736234 RepID=UPI0006F69098|nr:heavy metal translocating P-type ATPase [Paenibacillus sp. Leaf72]KQN99982.1 cadmium transporter [Paenibacillus sp. Leaf72]